MRRTRETTDIPLISLHRSRIVSSSLQGTAQAEQHARNDLRLTPIAHKTTQQLDRSDEDARKAASDTDTAAEPTSPPTGPATKASHPKDTLTKTTERSNWVVLAVIILCFVVIVQSRAFQSHNPQLGPAVGRTLDKLELKPLLADLKPVTLADLTGRVVLIHFWEASSSTSREALTHIAEIQRQFRGRPALRLLPVACPRDAGQTSGQLRSEVRDVLRQRKIDLPVYVDSNRISRAAVGRAIGSDDVPVTLILDRQGRIRGVWGGFRSGAGEEMQKLIAELLARV